MEMDFSKLHYQIPVRTLPNGTDYGKDEANFQFGQLEIFASRNRQDFCEQIRSSNLPQEIIDVSSEK